MSNQDQPIFGFGKNWASFSQLLSQERILQAQDSLKNLLGTTDLTGVSFLDIGCGSGLFAIAAARMGATVLGIDLDPISIETSQKNAEKWLENCTLISFKTASILNPTHLDHSNQSDPLDHSDQLVQFNQFDIVYSWGVLHHTGNMDVALKNAAQRVKPGGMFVISIYNRHFTSPGWAIIKRVYNRLPDFCQKFLIWSFTPIIFFAKLIATGKNPLKMHRHGMDFMHNIVDWLGGYPYEYASVSEMQSILKNLGAETIRLIPAQVPTGCNEFVCQMES